VTSVSTNFLFTVAPLNFAPSITPIGDQVVNPGISTGPLTFIVADAESPAASLIVSGDSSNPSLVSSNNIVFGGSGGSRTVTVTPAVGQTGVAAITIRVSDGTRVTSTVFNLGVNSPLVQSRTATNSTTLTIADVGVASLYPSVINVSGLGGLIQNVEATLRNVTHARVSDLDVLLVSPAGQKVVLCSDIGTGAVSNVTLTLSDYATVALPATAVSSGVYRPTNFGLGDTFPAPAPAGPHGSVMAEFNGQSPNGDWALYVKDDSGGLTGGINSGWSLKITTVVSAFTLNGFTTNGAAALLLQAPPAQWFSIEASDDLLTWEVLGVVQSVNGSLVFMDGTAWAHGSRFYRARPTP
jgi:subtilisin-like proprotein convertase family protein